MEQNKEENNLEKDTIIDNNISKNIDVNNPVNEKNVENQEIKKLTKKNVTSLQLILAFAFVLCISVLVYIIADHKIKKYDDDFDHNNTTSYLYINPDNNLDEDTDLDDIEDIYDNDASDDNDDIDESDSYDLFSDESVYSDKFYIYDTYIDSEKQDFDNEYVYNCKERRCAVYDVDDDFKRFIFLKDNGYHVYDLINKKNILDLDLDLDVSVGSVDLHLNTKQVPIGLSFERGGDTFYGAYYDISSKKMLFDFKKDVFYRTNPIALDLNYIAENHVEDEFVIDVNIINTKTKKIVKKHTDFLVSNNNVLYFKGTDNGLVGSAGVFYFDDAIIYDVNFNKIFDAFKSNPSLKDDHHYYNRIEYKLNDKDELIVTDAKNIFVYDNKYKLKATKKYQGVYGMYEDYYVASVNNTVSVYDFNNKVIKTLVKFGKNLDTLRVVPDLSPAGIENVMVFEIVDDISCKNASKEQLLEAYEGIGDSYESIVKECKEDAFDIYKHYEYEYNIKTGKLESKIYYSNLDGTEC